MATWKVEPTWKKSVIEREYWTKGDDTLVVETGWRWGEFLVHTETDEPPILEAGVNIYDCGYDSEMVYCDDGCWTDYDYDDCSDETQEWLEEFLEENSSYELEEHGWAQVDAEMIIDCEMEITRVEDENIQ